MFDLSQQKEAILRIAHRLIQASTGDLVLYSEIDKAAGFDVRATGRWIITRAVDLLIKHNGAVFETVRGEGLRRLGAASGLLRVGDKGILRIRRAARRSSRRMTEILPHVNDMAASEVRQMYQRQCALGLIEHLSMARTINNLPSDERGQKPDGLAPLRAALGIE